MPLGVSPVWRARSWTQRRLSLIPGDLLPQQTSPHLRNWSTITRPPDAVSSRPVLSISQDAARAAAGGGCASRTENTKRHAFDDTALSTFVERLAKVPVRRHGPRQSVLVQPPTVYAHKAETRRSQTRSHKAVVRQHRLDCVRIANNGPAPDWRLILWNLGRWTPEYSPEQVEDIIKVITPPDAIEMLIADGEHSARSIRSRIRNLSMKIHPGDSKDDELPYVLLSRSAQGRWCCCPGDTEAQQTSHSRRALER